MSRVRLNAWGLVLVLGLLACGGDGSDGPVLRVPGAPGMVSAIPGDGQATVSWSAPADDGGSPIQRYSVQALRDGAVAKTQESLATSVTVTGLTNGATYTFVVIALNAQGEGARSAGSAPVVPRVTPGAPRDVTATAGNQQALVSWTEPADTGMPITGYTVTVRQGDAVVATQEASGLSATVSGLTNGTSYLVSVSARNSVLAGPESAAVAVMPVTTPAAPQGSLDVYINQVTFKWTVPADNGGSPITGYTVTLSVDGTVVRTEETTETEFTFMELTNGTEYAFAVSANNAVGKGMASEPQRAMTCGYPARPTQFIAVAGDGEAQFSWVAPEDKGGCPVRYVLQTRGPEGTEAVSISTTDLSYRVTGLQNGFSYRFTLTTYNIWAGNESALAFVTPRTLPDAPGDFAAAPFDGAVRLTWTTPNNGGSQLFNYTVTVSPGEQPPLNVSRTDNELTVEGLTNGTRYTFTIAARNGAGTGPAATVQATPAAAGVVGSTGLRR